MRASVLRIVVLMGTPACCAAVHYLLAGGSGTRATHFVPAAERSAQTSPEVAERAGISLEEFQRVVVGRQAVIIDARDPDAYAEGHIPGARNFPVRAVENDVTLITSQIDPTADIVVYCEGQTCEDSSRLFDLLTQLLHFENVKLFRGGLAAWQAARLPIERTTDGSP